MEIIKEAQTAYREAKKSLDNAGRSLAALEARRMALEGQLDARRIEEANRVYEQVKKQWAAGNATREEVTAARNKVTDLTAQENERDDLFLALKSEIEAAESAREKARALLDRAEGYLWEAVAKKEKRLALTAALHHLRRGHAAWNHFAMLHRLPGVRSFPEFVEQTFSELPRTDEDVMPALLAEFLK